MLDDTVVSTVMGFVFWWVIPLFLWLYSTPLPRFCPTVQTRAWGYMATLKCFDITKNNDGWMDVCIDALKKKFHQFLLVFIHSSLNLCICGPCLNCQISWLKCRRALRGVTPVVLIMPGCLTPTAFSAGCITMSCNISSPCEEICHLQQSPWLIYGLNVIKPIMRDFTRH